MLLSLKTIVMCICKTGKLALHGWSFHKRIQELFLVSPEAVDVHCLGGRLDSDAGFEITDCFWHGFIQQRSHHSDLFPLVKSTELAFFNFPFLTGIELLDPAICSSC